MNKADEEILEILRHTFRRVPKTELIDPDEVLQINLVKGFLLLSLFSLAAFFLLLFTGKEIDFTFRAIIASPITVFFGLLFFRLNQKSENPSVILFFLTLLSMTLGLYF